MSEPVLVDRTGQTLDGYFDPDQLRLYVEDEAADVAAGDVLTRAASVVRVDTVQVWHGAGVVAVIAPEAAPLTDAGQILRPSSGGLVLNETTGALDPAAASVLWSGPCLVEPAQSDGSNPEIGDQQVGIVPFTVTVPLAVTDVRPGDLFKVTSSKDTRLTTRTLVVKAIRASSTALVREVLAFDNQGGA